MEAVWYPSTEVHLLRRRVDSLERDISQLSRAFATKDDVRNLRDGVDIPLSQLSKAVRRFDKKEEYLRLSSEEVGLIFRLSLKLSTHCLFILYLVEIRTTRLQIRESSTRARI